MASIASAPHTPTIPNRVDPRTFISLTALYVIWGSTYLAMRIAVAELPPFLMAGMRYATAGAVMFAFALRRGTKWPPARDWLRVAPIGVLLILGGNGMVAMSERTVTSGGAAVVVATMPLWVGVLGVLGGGGDRPSRREWVGLAIGFAGVVVLMGGPSLAGDPIDIAAIVIAPISWAIGSVLARRLPANDTTRDPFMLPALEMLVGGAVLGIVGFASGQRLPADASANAWLAVGYLVVFGSLLGFTAYSWLTRNTRPAVATSYAYVNPVVAVLIGVVLTGEPLGVSTVIANAMIVGAVILVLRNPAKR